MGGTVSKTDIDTEIDAKLASWNASLAQYALKTDLTNYAAKTDLTTYAAKTDIPTNYAQQTDLDALKSDVSTNYALKTDLSTNYAQKTDLATYALKSQIPTNYALKTDLDTYALKADVSNTYALKTDLSTYALKSQIPTNYALKTDLSTYALKSDIPTNMALKTDLTTYALKSDIPTNYALKTDLGTYALKSDIPTNYALKTDLNTYALKSDIPNVTSYALKTDLGTYALKTDIPNVTSYALKTDLPSLTNYLTRSDFEGQMNTRSLWCSADGTVCTVPAGYGKTAATSATSVIVSPQMTSDTFTAADGTYVSSASSIWATGNAFKAFNTAATVWMSNNPTYTNGAYSGTVSTIVSGIAYAGEWLQLKMPYNLVLTSFKISPHVDSGRPEAVSPRTFVIAGSNNGTDWYMVYNQTTPVTNWTVNVPQSFSVSPSTTAYAYYRMIVSQVGNTVTSTANCVSISNLTFVGYKA